MCFKSSLYISVEMNQVPRFWSYTRYTCWLFNKSCFLLWSVMIVQSRCFLVIFNDLLSWTDEKKIGQITFEMMLNVNYSDLKLHISELAESIAQELGINSSQVRQVLYWNAMQVYCFIDVDANNMGVYNHLLNRGKKVS